MEKRLVGFLLGAMLIMLGYMYLLRVMGWDRPVPAPQGQGEVAEGDGAPGDAPPPAVPGKPVPGKPDPDKPDPPDVGPGPDAVPDVEPAPGPRREENPHRLLTLGSVDPNSAFRMGVTFTTRGAAVERIELSDPRYRDLVDKSGYLGHLALEDEPDGTGCRVGVVVPGTPAAESGLRVGDVILAIDGKSMPSRRDVLRYLGGRNPGEAVSPGGRKPGDSIKIRVARPREGKASQLELSATLVRRPLEVVRPEPLAPSEADPEHPLSFLLSLASVGGADVPFGEAEFADLPSLRDSDWAVTVLEGPDAPGIEFRMLLDAEDLSELGQTGAIEIVKRYRLVKGKKPVAEAPLDKAYHLSLDVEIRNLADEPRRLAYTIDGPTGLPLEGWWYAYKVHPRSFGSAGPRDVVCRSTGGNHLMFTLSKIVGHAEDEEEELESIGLPMLGDATEDPAGEDARLEYIGVDAQYFTAALLPRYADEGAAGFSRAVAKPVGKVITEGREQRRTNVTFQLTGEAQLVPARGALTQSFTIFAGPKQPAVLAHYGLDDVIVYGWFGKISKPLLAVLHWFYMVVRNYGLAIFLLTVLVRGLMMPLGRKQALNAQKMQELAPEMKKIADKHKNDMEKRSVAQRELFKKHNYNPLAGCWLMFLQLPIFIGLYRGLTVDIALRQAPLIPGVAWCSNLAGPDMLFYWGGFMPHFIAGPGGFLGPFFNLLPLFSVGLFLVHQKLFTPPATDDQQQMQQTMMKFMTLFIGVLFFKVAAGLCLYFITSSLWGVAERKFLPKPKPAGESAAAPPTPSESKAEAKQAAKIAEKKSARSKRRKRPK